MRRKIFSVLILFAATAFAGSWNGTLGNARLGLMLDVPAYDQAGFALLEQGGDALEELFPGSTWESLDSSLPAAIRPGRQDSLASLGDTGADRAARATALGRELDRTHILVLRRGGTRAEHDSSTSFQDSVSFTLWETSSGSLLLHQSFRLKAGRSKLSAESEWAREAWKRFAKAVKAKR